MRRLYPVPFRLLDGPKQFHRWDWIRARVTSPIRDNRPESRTIDVDSIQTIDHIDTDHNWDERMQWISPHILGSFLELEERRQNTGETLGFICPTSIKLLIKKSDNPNWTTEESEKLTKTMLFDSSEVRNRQILEKIPFDFYYLYKFSDDLDAPEFKHKITDWEICALYRNLVKNHGTNWQIPFTQKLESEFSSLHLTFLMGTMHRFPDIWLIVGLVYPPKVKARQPQLFLASPGD